MSSIVGNTHVLRANLPGTREEDCYSWNYESIDEIKTELAAQEYLQSLIRRHRFDIDTLVEVPPGVESLAWLYEHMRQICVELGYYLSTLHGECTELGCSVMRASETTYYCAGHGRPRPCSAMGYSVHTLDYAVRQLGSAASFPDRRHVLDSEIKHFQSMARRLYRVFAHAYFHHREVFERQEATTGLYARFVRLARKYELTPESLIIVPELPTTI
ncbi:hypothetical protein GGH91_000839 [Coemansia sp. RSA 2671]|uniref:Uncharacterized protein n=1 Tax=Coemansia spiralis TaxID=417178 RepID=A0A9W8GCB9_9FUNG|nr:hypothetical protein LPJ60_004514 [Coemansia sp. RSA 2675]KAJ2349380.1 hypothetical protein GGH91_000839 [Coemansia sp. RSA 2671]KAJ2685506.1 hypothetical protein IWW39_004228 [Coemansia spiralis]